LKIYISQSNVVTHIWCDIEQSHYCKFCTKVFRWTDV